MTRAVVVAFTLWVGSSACLQPVDSGTHVITSCQGECPHGACDDACAGVVLDAGCSTPEQCLALMACQAAPPACTAYTAAAFDVRDPCSGVTHADYCLESSSGRSAIECRDGGQTSTDCTLSCDGGAPLAAVCSRACRKQYCVH